MIIFTLNEILSDSVFFLSAHLCFLIFPTIRVLLVNYKDENVCKVILQLSV